MTETRLDANWRAKQKKKWSLKDIPFYKKGTPDVESWQNIEYLEIYDKVYGEKWGANGIGKLREVALTRITEDEDYKLYTDDPAYFKLWQPNSGKKLDIRKWQEQQENYAKVLRENGVQVHWIDFEPAPPMAAFGPMTQMWAAADLLVIRGGSIIPKMGWNFQSTGRSEYLARWAFWYLNIPPVLAIVGKGVCEAGASIPLTDDVFVTALSLAYNQDGVNQLTSVLKRTGTKEVLVMKMPGDSYFDLKTGVSAHPDMVIAPLDLGKAIVFAPGLDAKTRRWLRERRYSLVEAGLKEQINVLPCNLTILEPGKVVMQAGATQAAKAVRKLGVDVIEVPYSEGILHGGGVCCATMRLRRDAGPTVDEIKR